MLEADETPLRVDGDPDRVKADKVGVGAVGSLDQPASGHLAYALSLVGAESLEWASARVQALGLYFAERERGAVEGDDVELSPAGAVVALHNLESEPGEMLGGELLAVLAEAVTEVGAHA